jgi:hypothetical protein
MSPQTSLKETRENVLQSITSPLQLGALLLLITESLIAALIFKLNPEDSLLACVSLISVLAIAIIGAIVLIRHKSKNAEPYITPYAGTMANGQGNYRYDIFLASPMAALDGKDFTEVNKIVKNIKKTIENKYGYKVFYAGSDMETADDFQKVDLSLEMDIDALINSKQFMMIYPEKMVSSVLAEAGMALIQGKPSYYFGKTDNLPFLLREAQNNVRYKHIKLYDVDGINEIADFIEKDKNYILKG